jgi:hypothetical protein
MLCGTMMALFALIVLCGVNMVLGGGHSQYHEGYPTPAPTTEYHHENEVMFEYIAIAALSVMVLILFTAFFGHWCFAKFVKKKDLGPLDSRDFGRESSRTDPNKHSIEMEKLSSDTPLGLLNKVKRSLDIRVHALGDIDLPEYWRVPSKDPWPQDLWGFELGKVVNSMCGTTKVNPNSAINVGGIAKKNMVHSLQSHGSHRADDHDEEEHRHETWYELFYDLVFVASALQLGMVIKYDHRLLGMLKASVLFLMLRSTWDHLTMYQNR